MIPPNQLRTHFEARIAVNKNAIRMRAVLALGVLLIAALIVIGAVLALDFESENQKWALGLAATFFASLAGFPIKEIRDYTHENLADKFILNLLEPYTDPPLPDDLWEFIQDKI